MEFVDLKKLADLLKPKADSSDSDEEVPRCGKSKFGPADIAPKSKSIIKIEPPRDPKPANVTRCIWRDDEIPDAVFPIEEQDPRAQPVYDLRFKQTVGTEDVFLGMSGKSPSDCEDLVVELKLPGESRGAIDLEVTENMLELRSIQYRLSLPLPRSVDPKTNHAVWDKDRQVLIVTLRILPFMESALI